MAFDSAASETATIVPDADFYRAKARRLERRADAGNAVERQRCRAEAARLRAAADALAGDRGGHG
jgi:hypothetical protein